MEKVECLSLRKSVYCHRLCLLVRTTGKESDVHQSFELENAQPFLFVLVNLENDFRSSTQCVPAWILKDLEFVARRGRDKRMLNRVGVASGRRRQRRYADRVGDQETEL